MISGHGQLLQQVPPQFVPPDKTIQRQAQKASDWLWTKEHDQALAELQKLVSSASLLIHYDSHKSFLLLTDASKSGLGAVLSREDALAVVYASRALTQTCWK